MILRRLLKTIQSEENSFQVSRSIQSEERLKTGRKRLEGDASSPPAPTRCAPASGTTLVAASRATACSSRRLGIHTWTESGVCLFSKLDRSKKPNFLLLNPK